MYAAMGRYCEAISPVETFVAFDPASRRTQQSMSMILEYSNKGNCRVAHARGNARVTLAASGNVHTLNVVVNGMRGNFILDTGASYLSVTTAFAEKTKINVNTSTKVPIKVVAGTVQAKLSTAATVAVGGAEARNVTVAVIDDSHEPFGPRTDGLLGMSFLARFEVRLTPNGLELTSPQSKDRQEIDQTASNTNVERKGRSPR
jgi:clan AA aspartic protease (TIGR02281 family)